MKTGDVYEWLGCWTVTEVTKQYVYARKVTGGEPRKFEKWWFLEEMNEKELTT